MQKGDGLERDDSDDVSHLSISQLKKFSVVIYGAVVESNSVSSLRYKEKERESLTTNIIPTLYYVLTDKSFYSIFVWLKMHCSSVFSTKTNASLIDSVQAILN